MQGWNPEIRSKVRRELGLENSLVIGNVARFEKQKNHMFLIKVFKEIKDLHPNSRLLLVGNGSREKEIRTLAEEKGILDSIVFTGVRDDVNALYQAMDVFVLSSFFEGMPLVMVEAQVSGLPCFISDTVSTEGAVTDLVHYLSLNMPPKTWAKEILSGLIPEEARRDRREEIERAGFDTQTTAEKLCSFYSGLSRQ